MSAKTPVYIGVLIALWTQAAMAQSSAPAAANLTVTQIVDKHVAARGGLQAWRAVEAISLAGKMDAGSADRTAQSARIANGEMVPASKKLRAERAAAAAPKNDGPQVQLPFVIDMKRPNKSRVEIVFAGKTAVQVFDGTKGWKLRPYLNRNDVEPFTAEEAKTASGKVDLDVPLIDYAAKGTKVVLESVEPTEGHPSYKLKLTMKDGAVQHIWIDAQTFLDVKVEGTPRRLDGRMHDVWVYQRDFRTVDGLKVPFLMETAVDGYPETHKMVIEKVTLNPKLDDASFSKPRA